MLSYGTLEALAQENFWKDSWRYRDAERNFYEALNMISTGSKGNVSLPNDDNGISKTKSKTTKINSSNYNDNLHNLMIKLQITENEATWLLNKTNNNLQCAIDLQNHYQKIKQEPGIISKESLNSVSSLCNSDENSQNFRNKIVKNVSKTKKDYDLSNVDKNSRNVVNDNGKSTNTTQKGNSSPQESSEKKRTFKGNTPPSKSLEKKRVKKTLTPYQGDEKTFGEFQCHDCKNFWKSPHSWANHYQKCKMCNANIYPHKQYRLLRSGRRKKRMLPHPEELCQRCIKLRSPCWIKQRLDNIEIQPKSRMFYNNRNEE